MELTAIAHIGLGFFFTAMLVCGLWCVLENRRINRRTDLGEYAMIVMPIFMFVFGLGREGLMSEAIFVSTLGVCSAYGAARIYGQERLAQEPSWKNLLLCGVPLLALAAVVISIEGAPGPFSAIMPE